MRKLKLQVEALEVESFRTSHETRGRGTIRGLADASTIVVEDQIMYFPRTAPPAESCDTCHHTCETMCSCATLPCASCACPLAV
jgi:hypothetical protein